MKLPNIDFKIIAFVLVAFLLGYAARDHMPTRAEIRDLQEYGVDTNKLSKIYSLMNENFVPSIASSSKPSLAQVSDSIIQGYVNSYNDPYTQYFPKEESKAFKESVTGVFGGVGMHVGKKDSVVTVIAPLKESPAEKAGVKAGDFILKVNDIDVTNMQVDKIVNMIRGEIGTEVKLELYTKGSKAPRTVSIKREEIKVPSITATSKKGVSIIAISNFNQNVATDFEAEINNFLVSGNNKLIIDLRGNPGGFLDAAVEIASLFLPEGKVIVGEKKVDGQMEYIRSKGYYKVKDKKIIVLIDGGSASASEILAGALKDQSIATLIGEKSYGKGSVQQIFDLSDDSSIKITVAKWFTPNGVSITENGIKPDIEVKPEESDYDKKIDRAMDKAIEIINK